MKDMFLFDVKMPAKWLTFGSEMVNPKAERTLTEKLKPKREANMSVSSKVHTIYSGGENPTRVKISCYLRTEPCIQSGNRL